MAAALTPKKSLICSKAQHHRPVVHRRLPLRRQRQPVWCPDKAAASCREAWLAAKAFLANCLDSAPFVSQQARQHPLRRQRLRQLPVRPPARLQRPHPLRAQRPHHPLARHLPPHQLRRQHPHLAPPLRQHPHRHLVLRWGNGPSVLPTFPRCTMSNSWTKTRVGSSEMEVPF